MQLSLVRLGYGGERVEVAQQLHPIMGMDVVHAVAEHLQEGVEGSPGVGFVDCRKELAYEALDSQRFDFGVD